MLTPGKLYQVWVRYGDRTVVYATMIHDDQTRVCDIPKDSGIVIFLDHTSYNGWDYWKVLAPTGDIGYILKDPPNNDLGEPT